MGILTVYGTLEQNDLIWALCQCFQHISEKRFAYYLASRIPLNRRCENIVEDGQIWWFSDLADEPEALLAAIRSRKNIPYKWYTMEQYIRAQQDGFLCDDRCFHRMTQYLKRKKSSEIKYIGALVDSIQDHMNNLDVKNDSSEWLQTLCYEGIDDVREAYRLYTDLCNHTVLWINKGRTPEDLYKAAQQGRAAKTGRNDPCPCGRKYKNCCGKTH